MYRVMVNTAVKLLIFVAKVSSSNCMRVHIKGPRIRRASISTDLINGGLASLAQLLNKRAQSLFMSIKI